MEPEIDDIAQPRGHNHSHRMAGMVLFYFSLLLILAIVHGTLAFRCFLVNEFRRVSPWELALLCLGDAIGLFWFLRFWFRWQFASSDEFQAREATSRVPGSAWLLVASMVIGLTSELAMTVNLMHQEYTGFQRAAPATCLLRNIHAQIAAGHPTYWKLDGDYQDAVGRKHRVTYYVRERDGLVKLPPPIVITIRQKQPNVSLPIVYDPERPGRSWIPQLGWDDGNRLHYMSFTILFFQFVFSLLFLIVLAGWIKSHNQLPGWAEYHGLIPLGCQAFIFALFGIVEVYLVRRFCP